MKGSTLHRSGLTREKMSFLATFFNTDKDKKQNTKSKLNQYYETQKNQELDVLWGGVKSGIQKVHSATKGTGKKSPAAYLLIGFIAGVVFMSLVTLIVSISAMTPKVDVPPEEGAATNSAVVSETPQTEDSEGNVIQEKYIVKQGDTLNGIAYRFYGKYDEEKFKEIQRVNNISNPESLSIGQELIIPVER